MDGEQSARDGATAEGDGVAGPRPVRGRGRGRGDTAKKPTLRSALPQIMACMAANSFYIPDGAALGYSAILIPQLELPRSDIKVTRLQTEWLTSLMMLVVPVGEVLAVLLMDRWGRINALRLSLVPYVVGTLIIALADSFALILVGKVLVGLSLAVGTSPASIYATEVARPDLRGALITAGPLLGAAGQLVAYGAGALMGWRGVAYCCIVTGLIPFASLAFCPESPEWLVSRGRVQAAREALVKLAPLGEDKEVFASRELQSLIVSNQRAKSLDPVGPEARGWVYDARAMCAALLGTKAARRPLILMSVIMLLQQFTGSYVTLFYAVTFFQDVQSSVDDYSAAALVSVLRLVMAIVTLPLLSRFGRRTLLLFSAIAMGISMTTSGCLSWIEQAQEVEPTGVARWLPAFCVLIYVCSSCVGVLSVPWILAAELFPVNVRSWAQGIILSLAHFFMFIALQTYRELTFLMTAAGTQWLYSSVCFLTVVITLLFLPESQGKTQQQITDFFHNHILYRAGRDDDTSEDDPFGSEDLKHIKVFTIEGARQDPEGASEIEECTRL